MTPAAKDIASTVGGAGVGYLLLQSVDWKAVAGGETTKVGIALLLFLAGYFAYKGQVGAAESKITTIEESASKPEVTKP